MKKVFLLVFGFLLTFSIVRYFNDAAPLTVTAFLAVLEEFPLDIKEDFQGVLKAFNEVVHEIEEFSDGSDVSTSSSGWIFSAIGDEIEGVVTILTAIVKLIVAFVEFFVLLLRDVVLLLSDLFRLLFGVEVDKPTFEGGSGGSLLPELGGDGELIV